MPGTSDAANINMPGRTRNQHIGAYAWSLLFAANAGGLFLDEPHDAVASQSEAEVNCRRGTVVVEIFLQRRGFMLTSDVELRYGEEPTINILSQEFVCLAYAGLAVCFGDSEQARTQRPHKTVSRKTIRTHESLAPTNNAPKR